MNNAVPRDAEYAHGGTRVVGLVCSPEHHSGGAVGRRADRHRHRGPEATPPMRRQREDELVEVSGLDYQLRLYNGTTRAFTSPKAANSPKPELRLQPAQCRAVLDGHHQLPRRALRSGVLTPHRPND